MQIYGNYDVVVIGGGVSGCAAAIASARVGAKTILIESLGVIGGMMNVTGPPGWAFSHLWNDRGEQIIAGFVEETHHRLEREGHALPYPQPQDRNFTNSYAFVDPDWWGLLIFEMMTENKVELLLHSPAVDILKKGDTAVGVVVENTSGRMAVMGKIIIEATGEGDMAVKAGIPFTEIDRTKEELDPPSITFHMDGVDWDKVTAYMKAHPDESITDIWGVNITPLQEAQKKKMMEGIKNCRSIIDMVKTGTMGVFSFHKLTLEALNNGDFHPFGDLGFFFTPREGGHVQPIFQHSAQVRDCDTTNLRELNAGEVEARKQVVMAIKAIRKYLPGFENAYLTRLTCSMRTREGRHLIGDYQMQTEDVAGVRKYPDVIAKSSMPTMKNGPFHSASRPGMSLNVHEARVYTRPTEGGSYDFPYRCLVPKNVENMLITGKLTSVSEDFKRDLLPENIATGQAAGVAAALCALKGLTPRQMEQDVKELQNILKKQGAILTGTH
jgi:hypothetical protein